MKQLKPFLPSLYSEYLLTAPTTQGDGRTDQLLGPLSGDKAGDNEGDLRGPGGTGKGTYERGLGETFGFPGDARKMRERSKMKLWKEYYTGMSPSTYSVTERKLIGSVHGRNLTCKLQQQDGHD